MIKFLRSFFGISETGNRTVVGGVVQVDVRHVQYIKNSNMRLSALQHLYNRYKGTPHAAKIKEVYEKTKNIHAYLVFKKKPHELELFHIQNTDHFINTFTVILDVHQKHAPVPTIPDAEETSFFKNFKSATATLANKTRTVTEAARPAAGPRVVTPPPVPPKSNLSPGFRDSAPPSFPPQAQHDSAAVTLPDIAIDTSSSIQYTQDGATAGAATREIGFTATNEERDTFLAQVSVRLGINKLDISYVGNAKLTLPSTTGPSLTGFVPILHWRGSAYALNLQDYRIFPVKMYRRVPQMKN